MLKKKRILTETQKRDRFSEKEHNLRMQQKAGLLTESQVKTRLKEAWTGINENDEEEGELGGVDPSRGAPEMDMGDDLGGEDEMDMGDDLGDEDGLDDMDVDDDLGDDEGVDLSNPEELAARLADRIADVIEDTLRVSIDVESDGVPLDDMDDDLGGDFGGDDLEAPDEDMAPLEGPDEDEEELMELKGKGPKTKTPAKGKCSVPDQKPKPAGKAKDMTIKERLAKRVASEIAKTLMEARAQKTAKSKVGSKKSE